MKKTGIMFLCWLYLFLLSPFSLAKDTMQPVVSPVDMQFHNGILTLTNLTKKPINLRNSILSFYYNGHVAGIAGLHDFKLTAKLNKRELATKPHNAGDFYVSQLNDLNKNSLLPRQSLQVKLLTDQKSIPHGFQLSTFDRVPVQAQITAKNQNWVTTISVCNTSSTPIPLTDIELNFNYSSPMPTNIWGSPWAAWKVSSQNGSQVVLLGGTPWTPALPSDPNCMSPLTVQFNAAPSIPLPTGPFVFKSSGGTPPPPTGVGKLTVSLSQAPASGITNNPEITVTGMNTTKKQVVAWGGQWQLVDLTPGSYTVTATPVDNGTDFFQASPVTVAVNDQTTAQATVSYTAVPSGQVTVTLNGAPQPQQTVTFTGQKYTLQKSVSNGVSVRLPADTYTITSVIPGYTTVVNPNPLVVPNNTTLTITYRQTAPMTGSRFVGYYESWAADSQTSDGTKTNLANIPSYVNVVNLSFVKPDAVYTKGSLNLSGTGLEFNYSGAVLKQAIATLHQRNPNTKILAAVGGASFSNWNTLNARAIADFVTDFGLDGVDIDYEPTTTGCAVGSDGHIHCQIDAAFQGFVQSLRNVLPRPFWLTVTSYSTGAYGEDQWKSAPPQGQYTGIMLPLLRSAAAQSIDMVNVMSYDAGTTFDPIQALAAYSNYYAGPISMGVEVPPEAWGGNVYTLCKVINLVNAVKTTAAQKGTPAGMMMWSLQKQPNGTPTPNNPSAQMIATTICTNLDLSNCTQPLLINGFAASWERFLQQGANLS